MAQKLGEKIRTMASELGSTPEGSAWCLKALHPSDPSVEVRGIPDRSSVPSTLLNYQTMYRLGADAGVTGTWDFSMQCLPHPVTFAWTHVSSSTAVTSCRGILNSQLPGTTYATKLPAWTTKAERWRLAYAGITFHFDGPALANQGTLAAAQVPYAPRTRYSGVVAEIDGGPKGVALPAIRFPDGYKESVPVYGSDYPTFEKVQSMPNCYVGEAKHGLYVPLKLTKTCQQWRSNADNEFWSLSSKDWGTEGTALVLPHAADAMENPHPGLPAAWYDPVAQTWGGTAIPPMGNDVLANVCGRNISVDSTLVLEFRYGFEVQCEPGTELTPFLRLSPPHDSVALNAYSSVSRELKDAYPAEFNDLGKLWGVIQNVARLVAPALIAVPKVGPVLSGIAGVIGGSRPAASEERERALVNQSLRRAQTRTPKVSKPAKPKAKAAKPKPKRRQERAF